MENDGKLCFPKKEKLNRIKKTRCFSLLEVRPIRLATPLNVTPQIFHLPYFLKDFFKNPERKKKHRREPASLLLLTLLFSSSSSGVPLPLLSHVSDGYLGLSYKVPDRKKGGGGEEECEPANCNMCLPIKSEIINHKIFFYQRMKRFIDWYKQLAHLPLQGS